MTLRLEGVSKVVGRDIHIHPTDLTLEKARARADEARQQIADGQDPTAIKRMKKAERKVAAENTFAAVAERLVAKKRKDGRADVTIAKMDWILGKLKLSLGSCPIATIRTPEIIQALKKEEDADNLETARRMRTVIGEVFRHTNTTRTSPASRETTSVSTS